MTTSIDPQENSQDLRELTGLIATVNLTGRVTHETSDCLLKMGLWNAEHGFVNVEYKTQPAQLVEAGRDAVCQHALKESYDFLLMFDGDSTFPADSLARMLHTAYREVPQADVVGAYAQLKHEPHLPVIDTGTGTWEPHYPGEGILPVIRTGGHFLLVKTSVLRSFGPPWFRTRRALRPLDALHEIDNYARIKLDGRNPLADDEAWSTLAECAIDDSGGSESNVGEDSGFCDRVKAAGGSIVVNTNIVTGHVSKRVIGPSDLKQAMDARERKVRLACGVVE